MESYETGVLHLIKKYNEFTDGHYHDDLKMNCADPNMKNITD
jgi:hypothetical protein